MPRIVARIRGDRTGFGSPRAFVGDRDGRKSTDQRGDAQGLGVGGEIRRKQAVERRNAAAPRLEVVEVGAIGPLGRQGDPGLNVHLDLSRQIVGATRRGPHPAGRG